MKSTYINAARGPINRLNAQYSRWGTEDKTFSITIYLSDGEDCDIGQRTSLHPVANLREVKEIETDSSMING